ncbi:DNA cytosine methyltransferase, partial [Phenylobacterium sp.]|uniref:DNA cytosine methyltransferase n=1 Tax=Phenylobacterium sp. TaxID=1871053 RepID=UPI0025CCD313
MTKPFTYLSVCSGIEAASVAWESLGWRPAAFAEIDPFACHVLAHRQRATRPQFMPLPEAAPGFVERRKRMAAIKAVAGLPDPGTANLTPNFGDLEAWRNWPDAAFDLLVGGTPCQSFSVAGLRQGLDDPRGNLALFYLGVA